LEYLSSGVALEEIRALYADAQQVEFPIFDCFHQFMVSF